MRTDGRVWAVLGALALAVSGTVATTAAEGPNSPQTRPAVSAVVALAAPVEVKRTATESATGAEPTKRRYFRRTAKKEVAADQAAKPAKRRRSQS